MKHLTFVGTGHKYTGPLPPGDVWNINIRPSRRVLARLTCSFQIHPRDGRCASEDRWLAECPVPIYVCGPRDSRLNPNARLFPWDQVPAAAPLSSSFDAAMFMALHEGFDSILIAGADLQVGTLRERLIEHVSLAFWLGVAAGRGVRVEIPRSAKLLRHPYRYGRDYWRERRWAQEQCLAALATDELDDGAAKVNARVRGVSFTGRSA